MRENNKLLRITTVPVSLKVLLKRQLRFMSEHFDVIGVSSPGNDLHVVEKNEGVRAIGIPMSRAITPLKDLRSLWQMYSMLRIERPLIVHTHTPKAGLIGMLAARLAGIPIRMHTVAGLPLMESKGLKRSLLGMIERITYSCAHRVYPNSFNLADYILQKRFCDSSKLKVLGHGSTNGIDTKYFSLDKEIENSAELIRKQYGIKDNDFVYLFIGRLVRDKGIEELVTAFLELKKKNQHVKLLLVGPYEAELDPISPSIAAAINEDENIIRVDFQEDVRPYLAVSNVLTFPSYREGFPNVPMQAGCFNLPSIVTDINGCNEIIEHNKNGLIIPAKNVHALIEAMDLIKKSPELYSLLQSNARKMIVNRFEQEEVWGHLLKEYHQQINESIVSPVYKTFAGSRI